jgi:hypothetical protein
MPCNLNKEEASGEQRLHTDLSMSPLECGQTCGALISSAKLQTSLSPIYRAIYTVPGSKMISTCQSSSSTMHTAAPCPLHNGHFLEQHILSIVSPELNRFQSGKRTVFEDEIRKLRQD